MKQNKYKQIKYNILSGKYDFSVFVIVISSFHKQTAANILSRINMRDSTYFFHLTQLHGFLRQSHADPQLHDCMIVENVEDLYLLLACHYNIIAIGENAIHETRFVHWVLSTKEKAAIKPSPFCLVSCLSVSISRTISFHIKRNTGMWPTKDYYVPGKRYTVKPLIYHAS